MAHFRAKIQGSRGEASRLGTKTSGMWASVDGWNVGVFITVVHENGRDCIRVFRNKGSNGHTNNDLIAEIVEDPKVDNL